MKSYEARKHYAKQNRDKRHAGELARGRRQRRIQEAEDAQTAPALPKVEDIADHEFLIDTYYDLKAKAGQAPGPDRVRYDDLGPREVGSVMRDLSKVIKVGEFAPSQGLRRSIPKASGGSRTLTIRSIATRVVAGALHKKAQRFWESIFDVRSFGFRQGLGTWDMLFAMEREISQSGRYVVAVDDVRQAFDNVPIDAVMECHRLHTQDEELLRLIETVLRGFEDRDRVRGIDQGSAYSPTALNVLLHHKLDTLFSNDASNPPWFRYADNLVYLCHSVSEGHEAIAKAQELLQPIEMSLKGTDGDPTDLRQAGNSVDLLGFHIHWENDQVNHDLSAEAWGDLEIICRESFKTPNPSDSAISAVRGWISYGGPAFEKSEEEPLVRRILEVAADLGFREVPEPKVRQALQSARDRCRAHRGRINLPRGDEGLTTRTISPKIVDETEHLAMLEAGSPDTLSGASGCPF